MDTRNKIATFARTFTNELHSAGVDSNQISKIHSKIDLLQNGSPESVIVLMTAHQPNLFAYSGVLRKIVLISVLQRLISEETGKHVLLFYGIADHDFAHNKWVRSAELGAPLRKEGLLRYSVKISQKDAMLPSNKIPKPPLETFRFWKDQTLSWLNENVVMAKKYIKTNQLETLLDPEVSSKDQFEGFWTDVERIYGSSHNLADFSSKLLTFVASEYWKQEVIFANFSECFKVFGKEYSWMFNSVNDFSNIIQRNENTLKLEGVDSGLAQDVSEIFPLWLKCACGSKYRLTLDSSKVSGRCVRCGSEISYTQAEMKEMVSDRPDLFEPRSIAMPIAFSRSFDMSCYVGGIGGLGYLIHTREISDHFSSPLCPTPFWYIDDNFVSIEMLSAAQQIKRLEAVYIKSKDQPLLEGELLRDRSERLFLLLEENLNQGKIAKGPVIERDKQLLRNIMTSLDTKGCMIDYSLNIGLTSLSEQWSEFLVKDGRLCANLKLSSLLEKKS